MNELIPIFFFLLQLYRNDKSWFKNGLLISFGFAFVMALIQTLQYLGASVAARSLSNSENLPYDALVAIEVSWIISVSMGTFLLGGQILSTSFGLICCFMLAYRAGGDPKHRLTVRHGVFGLVVAVFGVLAFIFQMVQALDFGRTFSTVTGIFGGILTVLFMDTLLPIWILWLAIQLGKREFPDDAERKNLVTEQL